ncbi:MAG: MFS transporter [Bacteroidales bacterium]|nr:MFS transporter [Bacteroidales bacterium]
MYDWANSVYQLTIASAIFPIYYNQVTRHNDDFTVDFFGLEAINTVLYSWAIAGAYLLFALFSPLLSSMADYTGRRKAFMKFFTWLGAISCGMLFFFTGDHVEFGIIFFALATLGYGGSLVFYNSFLPLIAESKDQDRISARGYSLGYLGGVVLLVINLTVILFPNLFGITSPTMPARIAFLTVFLWWIGFSQITFLRLPKYTLPQRHHRDRVLTKGYLELAKVFRVVIKSRQMTIYLLGFFFITMGLLTVMFMAATYGEKQLGLSEEILISTILLIQLVGMAGAYLFAWLSGKTSNLKALLISVFCWILICLGAWFITDAIGFMIVAFFVGLVMGGSQSLARSTYSKMIPKTNDHTSFFSFYDVTEKLAIVAGTFAFGAIEAITGSMRNSVLGIVVFFVIGFGLLAVLISGERRRLQER